MPFRRHPKQRSIFLTILTKLLVLFLFLSTAAVVFLIAKEYRLINIYNPDKDDVSQKQNSPMCGEISSDPSIPGLSYQDKEHLINLSYQAVADYFQNNANGKDFLSKFDDINNMVFVSLNINGDEKGSRASRKDNLARSVYTATLKTLKDDRFGGIGREEIGDLKIEIFILGEEKLLTDSNDYEPGIHGLRLQQGGEQAIFYNTVAIEKNYSIERLVMRLCKKAGLPENCNQDPATKIFIFPTLHFATTRFSERITTFYRANTILCHPENLTQADVKRARDLAVSWLKRSTRNNGSLVYLYDTPREKSLDKMNMVRFWGTARGLAELASRQDAFVPLHEANLKYGFKKWYRQADREGYIFFNGRSKLGANAMALRTLIYSPKFSFYKNKATALANSILALQKDDGSFRAFYIEPDEPYDEERNLAFYSGETILTLAELYLKTKEAKYLDAALKSQDYYLEKYALNGPTKDFPRYVSWQIMSLSKLYEITGEERYAQAVFVLSDAVVGIQNIDGKPYIDYLGRFYDPEHPEYGPPHAASTAVYLEGLSHAYEMARRKQDKERMKVYKKGIVLGAINLINLQFRGSNMFYLARPEMVEGAVRYRVDDSRIRTDTVQHMIDSFSNILKVFSEDEFDLDP